MHETFWMLMRDRAHWEFEMFLMLLFDGVLAGVWRLYKSRVSRRKPQENYPYRLKTPQGICEDCGGVVRHLIESQIKLCQGCGDIRVLENPAKNHDTPVTSN
jgi:hypothetical protein